MKKKLNQIISRSDCVNAGTPAIVDWIRKFRLTWLIDVNCPEYVTLLKSVVKKCFSSGGFCWDLCRVCRWQTQCWFPIAGDVCSHNKNIHVISQSWIEIHFIWKQCILKISFWWGSKGLFIKAFVHVDIRHGGGCEVLSISFWKT